VDAKAQEKTRSAWDYFLSRKSEFLNANYDPEVDDHVPGKERLIFPRKGEVRWWNDLFGRTDEEMNGPATGPSPLPTDVDVPALKELETADEIVEVEPTRESIQNARVSQGNTSVLTAGLASLGLGKGSPGPSRSRSPRPMGAVKEQMEVEMH